MSLRIIYGKAGTGKSAYFLNEIKNNPNKKAFIITPEQFSYSMERRLLEVLENNVSINVEVLSFKRLADRISHEVGGANEIVLSQSAQAMIIYSILQKQKDNLRFLNKNKENIDLILKEITELKKHNITPNRIDENIENISDINLQGKLLEIQEIYKAYESNILNKYIDEDDVLTRMYKNISKSNIFDNAIVYIDEFSGFTMQEYSVLEEILKKAIQVNVCVCTDNLNENSIPEIDIFYNNKIFANRIIKLAKKLDIEIDNEIKLEENYRLKSEELLHLEQNIYNIKIEKYIQKVNNIEIALTNDEYSELEIVAKQIIKLVRENCWKYSDISIISNDISNINNIVKAVFNKFEIPFFIDEKIEVTENILIKYMLSIIEIFSNNWSQESVLNYIKSGFTDIKKEDIYMVENYCVKNGIRGNKWHKTPWLEFADLQKKIVTPLINLRKNLDKGKTAKDISKELYNFLNDNKIQEKINQKIDKFVEENELEIAREYKASYEILIDVLDEIVTFFDNENMSFDTYKELLKIGLKNKKAGKIPQFMDQVLIGDIDRTRTQKVKAIFIIGMNDGAFPSVNKNEGFFDDKDRDILKQNNLEIAKNTLENLYEDQFNTYKAFSIAEEKLYVSYNSTNKEGSSLRPSVLINKIKKIFPNLKEKSYIIEPNTEIINVNDSFEALMVELKKLANGEKIEDKWYDIYNWYNQNAKWKTKLQTNLKALDYTNVAEKINEENIKRIYGEVFKTSVSKMEQYKNCPFSFHLKYGLRLKNIEEYRMSPIDTGTFMHEVLDEFFDRVDNIDTITTQEIEDIVNEIIDSKLQLNKNQIFSSSPKFIVLTNKLKNTIMLSIKYIVYQMQNSDFKPMANELEFSKKIGNIELVGKVDRLDIAQDKYIRIIDYKSSEKNINLNQMMAGTQIQLLTYIDIMAEKKNKEPAGVLYFSLLEPIIKESKNLTDDEIEDRIRKSFKMKGLILADIQVIKMMDNKLESGSSSVVPVYIGKDEKISEKKSSVVTKEQFSDLQETIRKTITKISKEIMTGNIEIKPMYDVKTKTSTCKYCEFKNICRFNPEENEYQYLGTKTKEEILEEIRERKE